MREGTVVVLCVSMYAFVCLLLRYPLHTSFASLKCGLIRFLMAFSIVWIYLRALVLQFWRHLTRTAAFHAPWRVLDGIDEHYWVLFKIQSV
jgi:hypothetical protein